MPRTPSSVTAARAPLRMFVLERGSSRETGTVRRHPAMRRAPRAWRRACVNTECTLHQLSPYIGKLKTTIARDLITAFTSPGNLVVDPFAGSGTIPFEAALLARRTFASDISPYSVVLCRAKLNAPTTYTTAVRRARRLLRDVTRARPPDLRQVPRWVRRFFHPRTLKEAITLASLCRLLKDDFLLACLLGILHHQRPGFLSYPSSHLVPYLRDRRYPRKHFPHLYTYRPLDPRLLAKIKRSYARVPAVLKRGDSSIIQGDVASVTFPSRFDSLITSPPYMNALDYGRDNRLRLWFLEPQSGVIPNIDRSRRRVAFEAAMNALGDKTNRSLKKGGYCILVIGEVVARSYKAHPSRVAAEILSSAAPTLKLVGIITDHIPDIRRSRRGYSGIKREEVLVYRKY